MTPRLALPAIVAFVALLSACGGGGASNSLSTPGPSGETIAAPDFPAGQTWFNVSEPLTIEQLRGKVVVLDFWTLGCINCQHVVPDYARLESEFGDALAVIGVHSGKYDREHQDDSIREAIVRLGITHPVVNDPDFVIWDSYGANAWPTAIVVDPEGNLFGGRSGEGVYAALQPPIADLVARFDEEQKIDRTPLPLDIEAPPIASAFLSFPGAVLADETGGRLFIADSGNNRILVSDLGGALQQAIGNGAQGFVDGPAAEAMFNQPQGLALSVDGRTLYVADTRNHAVRHVNLQTGEVTTVAGTGQRASEPPPLVASAESVALASPWGLQLIGGTLYIAMAGTHQIWALDLAAKTLRVVAGSGAEGIADGPPNEATLAQPSGLTTDGAALFWADPESSSVRMLPLADGGQVHTIVGTGLFDFGDVDGLPDVALLEHVQGITFAGGTLYVADTYNHKIRTIDPTTGEVRTIAGSGEQGAADGPFASSAFDEPGAVSVASGLLYVADTNNNSIRVLDLAAGTASTLDLSNLGVATAGLPGRRLTVSLPAQTIGAGSESLVVRISIPEGYHLNDLAPSELTLSTSNADAVQPQETALTFDTAEPSIELTVPLTIREGQAIVSATGEVYYCRLGEEAICLIDKVDIALPLTVAADGAAEAVLDYALPE